MQSRAIKTKPEESSAELQSKREHGFVPSPAFAIVYGALGDKDEAFAWLEKAYQERDPALTCLKVARGSTRCAKTRASKTFCAASAFHDNRQSPQRRRSGIPILKPTTAGDAKLSRSRTA